MKVKELIRLLSTVNQDADVWTEGCDCEAEPTGLTAQGDGTVVVRRENGPYDLEDHSIITLDSLKENKDG